MRDRYLKLDFELVNQVIIKREKETIIIVIKGINNEKIMSCVPLDSRNCQNECSKVIAVYINFLSIIDGLLQEVGVVM